MADFRRIVLALAVLALFAGLAGAQTGQGLQCNASVVPPQLRSEGVTELMGDIVLTCTGGALTATGGLIPAANFTVYTNTTVTSRLIGSGSVSEALLLVDEPGSGLAGYGPAVPLTPCQSVTLGGCPVYVGSATAGGIFNNYAPLTAAGGYGYNMFFGIVSGSTVTFNGVPVLAPGSTNRVYRITNVRVNASTISGGSTLPGSVIADVAISGSTSVNVNNSALTTGYVAQSLKTSLRQGYNGAYDQGLPSPWPALLQCNSYYGSANSSTPVLYEYLRYQEQFATAFKTRVNPNDPAAGGDGQWAYGQQNIPGYIYNAETGFTPYTGPVTGFAGVTYTGSGATGAEPGLADFGTRIKAVFSNIPSGVSIYVATSSYAGTGTTFVELIPSATYIYGTGGNVVPLTATTSNIAAYAGGPATSGAPGEAAGTIPVTQLSIINGSATAVWEVIATSPTAIENVDIPVALLYTANPGANSPALGTATVNLSYAPVAVDVPLVGSTAYTSASSSYPIPRFIDTSTAATFFGTSSCTTSLLFPFVTEQAGFDTGLAIANTSTDPFAGNPNAATAQAGTCTLNWYGASAPAATVTSSVASGTVWTGLTSLLAPGFQGYMIATCNFEYAHGFAFVSDLGARNLAMGYLALILNGPSGIYRPLAPAEVLGF